MDKFEDYINKSMTDHTPAEDGWNIPSEDVWAKASIHFPEEKEKKRGLWLFFGLGLVCLLGILFLLPRGGSLANRDMVTSTIVEENEQIVSEINKQIPTDKIDKATLEVATADAGQVDNNSNNSIADNSAITRSSVTEYESPSTSRSEDIKSRELRVTHSPVVDSQPLYQRSSAIINDQASSVTDLGKISSITTDKVSPAIETVEPELMDQVPILAVNNAPKSHESEKKGIQLEDMMPIITTSRFLFPKKEVTLGTTHFILSSLGNVDLGEIPEDDVFIDVYVANGNLTYSKWLWPSISMRTGVFYSSLKGDISFSQLAVLTAGDIDVLINDTYTDILQFSNLTQRGKVEFEEGSEIPTITAGDEVRFIGSVELKLKALQFPLFLQKHWYKKRMEFYVGGGPTLELMWAYQKSSDFDLIFENVTYPMSFNEPAAKETYTDYSIYALGGMKFYINQNYNVEFGLKINVSEPIFSGFDLGISHRWL